MIYSVLHLHHFYLYHHGAREILIMRGGIHSPISLLLKIQAACVGRSTLGKTSRGGRSADRTLSDEGKFKPVEFQP